MEFKKLMTARFFFTLATTMQAVVLGWQMYALTHRALDLGLIGLASAAPALGLAMYAGYLVDRSRPLKVYAWVLRASALSGLILLACEIPSLGWTQHQQVLGLYLASFVTGAARAFSQPSLFSLVPKLVSREQLAKAAAWTASIMQVARIAGPGAAGLIFGYWGAIPATVGVVISLILAQIALGTILSSPALNKIPDPDHDPNARRKVVKELLSGAVFIFKDSILLPALSLDMISVLFGGVTALLPIYADTILHTGSQGLGALRAAPALGAMLFSIWLARIEFGRRAGAVLFFAVAGFGASIIVFSLSHNFALSLFALFISGSCDSVSVVVRSSAVQLSSPDRMRGKISAVSSMFIGCSNEIGEFESGLAASVMGTEPSALFGGVMCLLTVSTIAYLSPALRKLDLKELARKPAQ